MKGHLYPNLAKVFMGKHVNVHMKDGSVLINVKVLEVCKEKYGNMKYLKCIALKHRKSIKIPLKEIAWLEPVTLFSTMS